LLYNINMEKLKFLLFSILTLSLMGFAGYWAVVTLQSGTEHVADQKIKQLEKENKDLKSEIEKYKNELSVFQSKLGESINSVKKEPEPEPKPEAVIYKYQDIITELQKLINDNVSLKQKSSGSSVGIVQKFLNIYNNTSNKVDNDYGASTEKAVMAFQRKEGLNADGEAGPNTFKKMIDWLKKQK